MRNYYNRRPAIPGWRTIAGSTRAHFLLSGWRTKCGIWAFGRKVEDPGGKAACLRCVRAN